ncbi:leucine rich repeat containing 51 [Clupea harengus]|uniref:Leucine-rich repeat-containing protein 51 n=1 Tax=Clupea harengus TaxID=7950 RepID=A0A6P8G2E4_CLUHA|nr:leucine rich repeat containing 51 [Clupea harengus]
MLDPPLDFSFKCLSTMADVLAEEPNPGLRPLKRWSNRRFSSRALRLNNNIITDLTGLQVTVSTLLQHPTLLAWIDLSFNDLSHIDPVLTELQQLRVLYLHGNSISKLGEVDKLGGLPFLQTLTLHGNALENERGYRGYVIAAIPQMKMMDFSAVTNQERRMSRIWHQPAHRHKPTSHSSDT